MSVPPDVPAVLERLRAIGEALPPSDGVACFNAMYLTVTERVRLRLQGATFTNPAFIERLDVTFAALYFDAVDASGTARNASWEPLFERRGLAGVLPLQFAVAGMNAHINHDLAVATVLTCREMRLTLRDPGVRSDYVRINDVLAEVDGEIRASYLDGPLKDVDRDLSPVLTLVGGWSISAAREAAWQNAEVLWELRRTPTLEAEFRGTLARTVGLVTRQLLTPL